MKILIAAITLLALTSFSHAETCTGRVQLDVVTSNEGLHIKGERLFNVGGCIFSEQDWKRVVRTCPMGSRCRVEGEPGGDDFIETVSTVTRIPATPYPEDTRAVEKLKKLYKRCMLGPYPEEGGWKVCDPAKDMTRDMEDRGYCFRAQPTKGLISTVRCH